MLNKNPYSPAQLGDFVVFAYQGYTFGIGGHVIGFIHNDGVRVKNYNFHKPFDVPANKVTEIRRAPCLARQIK